MIQFSFVFLAFFMSFVGYFMPFANAGNCSLPQKAHMVFYSDLGMMRVRVRQPTVVVGFAIKISCERGYFLSKDAPEKAVCLLSGYWRFGDGDGPFEFGSCIAANTCGVARSPRILGGNETAPGELPWMVKLEIYFTSKPEKRHVCGGSIISSKWILTAAHCFHRGKVDNIFITAGRVNFTSYRTRYEQRRVSRKVILHPDYGKRSQYAYDAALIQLDRPFAFNSHVGKICLPDRSFSVCSISSDQTSVGSNRTAIEVDGCNKVLTSGWGATEVPQDESPILRNVDLSVFPVSFCRSNASDIEICAGSDVNGRDACNGDSGGPLLCLAGGRWVATGIVSHGPACGMAALPGTYTRVCAILPWVTRTTRSDSNPQRCPRRLSRIANGRVMGRGRKVDATRNVVCRPGFVVSGPSVVACSNGRWSEPGRCIRPLSTTTIRQTCSRILSNLRNGRFLGDNDFTQGSNRNISCKSGYLPIGATVIFCHEGQWSEPGECQRDMQCSKSLPIIPNGRISESGSFRPGARRRIVCNSGFMVLHGSRHVYCLPTGRWTEPSFCSSVSTTKKPTTTETATTTTETIVETTITTTIASSSPAQCPEPSDFPCENGKCLDNRWDLCDGNDDCGDQSDETMNCTQYRLDKDLYAAVLDNNTSSCLSLLGQGATNNYRDRKGWTALHYAARKQNVVCGSAILRAEPTRVNDRNDYQWTPLMVAAYDGRLEFAKMLVDQFHADVSLRNEANQTALYWAIRKRRHDVVQYLNSRT